MQEVITAQEIIVQKEKYEKIQEKQQKKIERINRRQLREQQREDASSEDDEDSQDEVTSSDQEEPEEEIKVNKRGPYKRRKTSSATETRQEIEKNMQKHEDEQNQVIKKSFKTKNTKFIDEETLRNIDTEFILK